MKRIIFFNNFLAFLDSSSLLSFIIEDEIQQIKNAQAEYEGT